jgi:hypothetical protein
MAIFKKIRNSEIRKQKYIFSFSVFQLRVFVPLLFKSLPLSALHISAFKLNSQNAKGAKDGAHYQCLSGLTSAATVFKIRNWENRKRKYIFSIPGF